MSIARFAEYAAAFEKAFESDDWSVVEPYFTEDAVYETIGVDPFAGVVEGRDAVLRSFKGALDALDRRFDSRTLVLLEGPTEQEGTVWIRWRATYTLDGAPDMQLEGEETAEFSGDRIRRLEDRFEEATATQAAAYLETHAARLG